MGFSPFVTKLLVRTQKIGVYVFIRLSGCGVLLKLFRKSRIGMMMLGLKLNSLGAYLDHPHGAILPWATRVPMLVYPALLGLQASKDVYKSKTADERSKRLQDDAIRMGIPTVATVLATKALMAPDAEAFNTTNAAIAYFQRQNRPIFEEGQRLARQQYKRLSWLSPLIWGRLHPQEKLKASSAQGIFQSIEEGHTPLDVQVGGVVQAIRQSHQARLKELKSLSPKEQAQAFVALRQQLNVLHHSSMEAVLERSDPELREVIAKGSDTNSRYKALQKHLRSELKEGIVQFELPQRLEEDLHKLDAHTQNKTPSIAHIKEASHLLMRHETRLALPTNEDLSDFAGAFEKGHFSFKGLQNAMSRTANEFIKEAAVPFLGVGLASVGSGMVAGFLANRLQGKSQDKNQDVMKEGIFQYVANIAMCGFGAGAGLTVANALGFTKFRNPVARFGTIVAGLGAGIYGGALLANPLSNLIEAKSSQNQNACAGRRLELADGILHVDDIPTAFSVAGVQALKPWISPFFLMSGLKTAYGYRNVEPIAHSSPIPVNLKNPLELEPLFDATNPSDTSYQGRLRQHLKQRSTQSGFSVQG